MTDRDHESEPDRFAIVLLNALVIILGISAGAVVGYLIGFVGIIAIGGAGLVWVVLGVPIGAAAGLAVAIQVTGWVSGLAIARKRAPRGDDGTG